MEWLVKPWEMNKLDCIVEKNKRRNLRKFLYQTIEYVVV